MKARIAATNSLMDRNVPRQTFWRSMMLNQISTRFSPFHRHAARFGIAQANVFGVGMRAGAQLPHLLSPGTRRASDNNIT